MRALASGVLANDGFKPLAATSEFGLLYEQFTSPLGVVDNIEHIKFHIFEWRSLHPNSMTRKITSISKLSEAGVAWRLSSSFAAFNSAFEAFVRTTGGYSRRDPQYSGAQRGRPICRHRRRRCVNLKAITPPKIDDSAGFSAKLVRKRKSWRQEGGVENGDCWSQAPREVKMKAILDIDVFILGVFWKCPPFKLLELHSERVEPVSFSKPICRDPDDAMTISSRHSLRTPITS